MSEHILNQSQSREPRNLNWPDKMRMDAVVLAGTHRNPRRLINNQNKAFLELHGRPLVAHVVEECLRSQRIDRVVVVGPRNRLEDALESVPEELRKKMTIIQQRSRLLENVWTGFLASFEDGNNLPVNRRIETLLLGGHIPIRKKAHLHIIQSVYAAVAGQMHRLNRKFLHRGAVMALMERRFDEFRARFERQEWFMGRMGVETLLAEGHVLQESDQGIQFREEYLYRFFTDWESRFQKYVFVTGCDLPLLSAESVDDFLRRCNVVPGDFFIGVASESILKHFYKNKNGQKGIIRPYVSFREVELRAANVIIVRPNRIGNKELIQESFGVRKLTEWRNVFAMIFKLLKLSGRMQTVRMATLLQLVAVFKRHGFNLTARTLKRFIRASELEELLSRLFMTQLLLIETPYGGTAIDVDDIHDYNLLKENCGYWSEIQDRLAREAKTVPIDEVHRFGSFKNLEI